MTIRITRLLSGYIFIMVLNTTLLQILNHPCKESAANGTLKAACVNQTVTAADLQSLNANIESLDLSFATFDHFLTADSFSKLKPLKQLSLRNARVAPNLVGVSSDPNVFKALDNLQELDISGLQQNGFPKYSWPPNIQILKINKTALVERLDASDILALEYVDISNNEYMTKFPLFNAKAPVKRVIMWNAKLEEFTIKDLAPNCRITTMEFSILESSAVRQPAHYCDCVQVQDWMRAFGIVANNIQCKKNDNQEACENKFDESALAMRRECIGSDTQNNGWLMLFSIVFLITLTLITLAFAYRYARLRYHLKPINVAKYSTEEEAAMEAEDEGL